MIWIFSALHGPVQESSTVWAPCLFLTQVDPKKLCPISKCDLLSQNPDSQENTSKEILSNVAITNW